MHKKWLSCLRGIYIQPVNSVQMRRYELQNQCSGKLTANISKICENDAMKLTAVSPVTPECHCHSLSLSLSHSHSHRHSGMDTPAGGPFRSGKNGTQCCQMPEEKIIESWCRNPPESSRIHNHSPIFPSEPGPCVF